VFRRTISRGASTGERRSSGALEGWQCSAGTTSGIYASSIENPLQPLPSRPPEDLVRQVTEGRPLHVAGARRTTGRYLIRNGRPDQKARLIASGVGGIVIIVVAVLSRFAAAARESLSESRSAMAYSNTANPSRAFREPLKIQLPAQR